MGSSQSDDFLLAQDNPVRLGILVPAARGDLQRPTSAAAAKDKLADDFIDLQTATVHYHLTRLQDHALLPRFYLSGA
jgi:hypothetical protein